MGKHRRPFAARRTGASRTVFLIGRYAIKVPSLRGHLTGDGRGRLAGWCRGVLANQSEFTWHDYGGWRGRVAPVLRSWLLGVVQVYPRCEPFFGPDDQAGRERLPLLDPDPGDIKVDNFGLLGGQLVRLDYEMR